MPNQHGGRGCQWSQHEHYPDVHEVNKLLQGSVKLGSSSSLIARCLLFRALMKALSLDYWRLQVQHVDFSVSYSKGGTLLICLKCPRTGQSRKVSSNTTLATATIAEAMWEGTCKWQKRERV